MAIGETIVYKYSFDTIEAEFAVPQMVKLLHFGLQERNGQFHVWFQVRPGNTKQKAKFRIFATGEPIPFGAEHVATCTTGDGDYVWHLFQMTEWEWVE